MNRVPLVVLLSFITACTQGKAPDTADFFDDDESSGSGGGSGEALDVLVLMDSSSSMAEQSVLLARADLPSLLADWNYHIGITTLTDDYENNGATAGVDPGESGTLIGSTTVFRPTDDDPSLAFRRTLLCDTTCWSSSALDDSRYECTDGGAELPEDGISSDYLDCLCGEDAWQDHCGGGTEEGLESALLSLCLSLPDPPDACFDDGNGETPVATLRDELSYDLLRGGPLQILLISDEGDTSRRLDNGDDDPGVYLDFFSGLDLQVVFDVIGPDYDATGHDFECNSGGATAWGTSRYLAITEATGGLYAPIEALDAGDCAPADIGSILEEMF